MDILEKIIANLTSDEVRRFKILSNRFKADEEKKLIVLFDMIRSNKYNDDDSPIVLELYGEIDAKVKNRYYRLRNKLLETLEKSLVFYHFKYKDSIHAYYDIQLSILFRERGNYRVAGYFLKKAEKKAGEQDQFNILELIYEEYVQLAIKNVDVDIEEILDRRKANLKKIEVHRKLTQTIAVITQRLKKTNFSANKGSALDLLEKVRQQIEESAEIFRSTEGRVLVARTVATLLQQKSAFHQLAEYLKEQLQDFQAHKLFDKNNHPFRLQMRLWLVISLYKIHEFSKANEEIHTLEKEMKLFSKQNFNTYLFHYYNIKTSILKCLGENEQAGKELDKALKIKEIGNEVLNIPYLLVAKAEQQYIAEDYAGSEKTLNRLQGMKEYGQFSKEIAMHIELFGLLVAHQNGNNEAVVEEIKPFKKRFRKLLKLDNFARANRFYELVSRMAKGALVGKKFSINSAYKKFVSEMPAGELGSNEIISYDAVLLAMQEERSYYSVFLENL